MRTQFKASVAVLASAILVLTGSTAQASSTSPAQDVADLIADVAPPVGDVLAVEVSADRLVVADEQIEVQVPRDAADAITLKSVKGREKISVSLPDEVDVRGAAVADDGTVVFPSRSGDADVAVQVLDGGETRVQTVIPDAGAGHEFSYAVAGARPVLTDSGAVDFVLTRGGRDEIVATAAAPWARDAHGRPVATHYRVDGTKLVQIVSRSAASVYPVVADPTYSIGLGYYAHYNRAETKTIATGGWAVTGTAGVCAAAGSALAGPVGAAAVSAACLLVGGSIVYQAGVAENSSPKKCLYLRVIFGANAINPAAPPVIVVPGTYRDSRCK